MKSVKKPHVLQVFYPGSSGSHEMFAVVIPSRRRDADLAGCASNRELPSRLPAMRQYDAAPAAALPVTVDPAVADRAERAEQIRTSCIANRSP